MRQLEGGQRKAYGELSNELRRQHEGITALSEHTQQLREVARELEGARPVGRAHGRRRAAARGPPRRRQLPQAGDARQRGPARLHVPAAERPRHAHGREVPARQLRALPRGDQRRRAQAVPRPVPPRRARPGQGAHDARLPRRDRRHRRLPAAVHPERAGLRVRAGERPHASSTTRCATRSSCARRSRSTRCSRSCARRSTTSSSSARRARSSACSASSRCQWEKYAAQLDKVQQRFERRRQGVRGADDHASPRAAAPARQDRAPAPRGARRSLDAEIPPLDASRSSASARAASFGSVRRRDAGGGAGRRAARADARAGRGSRSGSPSRSSTRRRTRRPRRSASSSSAGSTTSRPRRRPPRARRSSPTSGKACRPTTARALAVDVAGAARRPRALEVSQDRLVEKETFRALGIATAPFRAVDDRAGARRRGRRDSGCPAVLKTRRGGYDGKGQAVLRAAADVDAAWAAARRRAAASSKGFVAVRPRAVDRRGARRATATVACWPVVENAHVDGILRADPRARARARRRAAGAGRGVHPAAARRRSTTSASAASSCSTSAASCSPTRWRRACTTAGTGRSRARRRASSRTTCARCSAGRSARPRRAASSAMVNCIGGDARPRRGARDPGRAPARLRQGAAARPQGRPRHRHRGRRAELDAGSRACSRWSTR